MGIYGANGNSSRTYLHRFLARAGETVAPGERVLDAGAGRAPTASSSPTRSTRPPTSSP